MGYVLAIPVRKKGIDAVQCAHTSFELSLRPCGRSMVFWYFWFALVCRLVGDPLIGKALRAVPKYSYIS